MKCYYAKINIHKDELVYSLRTPTVIEPCDVNSHIMSYIDLVLEGDTRELSISCLKTMYESPQNRYHTDTYDGVQIDIGLFATDEGGAL